jgi:cytochrome c-type biogenesis protein CcmF
MGVRHFYALMSLGLCLFVMWTIVFEFFKGSSAIRSKTGQNWLAAMVELTHRNTRRYGGYLVHVGIVAMFVGFTGAAFNLDETVEVSPGDTFKLGHYEMKVNDIQTGDNPNYSWQHAVIGVSKDGNPIGELTPEKRIYKASEQPSSVVAIRRRLNEDLYINFAGMNTAGDKYVIDAYVFPLVSWIWIGFWILFFGSLVCLVPSKVKLQYPKTQVVGVVPSHVPVKK